MKMVFTEKQLDVLGNAGLSFSPGDDLSDDQLFEMDEKVSDYLVDHGIDGDEINEIGVVCESILDAIAEM